MTGAVSPTSLIGRPLLTLLLVDLMLEWISVADLLVKACASFLPHFVSSSNARNIFSGVGFSIGVVASVIFFRSELPTP